MNRLQREYRRVDRPSLVGLPFPRRDLFAERAYYVRNTISTTRGCPYSCAFCTVTSFFGHTYRCRPVEEVVKEIETFQSRKFIAFLDDNIVGNPRFAKDLFRALAAYKTRWVAQASVTIARDEELLDLAARSGCISLFIGFESISPSNLLAMGKKINVVDEYEDVIRKIHSHGIGIHGFFIFGFDEDDEGVFKRTVQFARKMRLETAQFDYLTPYPGTAFGEAMERAGRVTSRDWSLYGHDLLFEPKSMPREALLTGHKWAWREFYSLPSICRRLGVMHRHPLPFWTANLTYRGYWRDRRSDSSGNS